MCRADNQEEEPFSLQSCIERWEGDFELGSGNRVLLVSWSAIQFSKCVGHRIG